MTLLHTADWHLGQTLYQYDRQDEHRLFFEQLQQIVRERQPDVLLVSGDIYHTAQPTTAAQTLFAEGITQLHNACPDMHIILTAGNHDSGSRLDIFHTPWQTLHVHTIGSFNRLHIEQHCLTLPHKAHIIALPYLPEQMLPTDALQQLIDNLTAQDSERLPIVLSLHTTIFGADYTGHKTLNEKSVGGIDAVALQDLPRGFDYLALGHIHRPQTLSGSEGRARYAGSPLPVSFDESYQHSVSWVEISEHNAQPTITPIPIHNPYPLVTLPTNGFASIEEALELLGQYPADIPAYLRLNVQANDFLPPTTEQDIQTALHGKQARFCTINLKREAQTVEAARAFTVSEFKEKTPLEIVKQYIQDTGNTAPPDLDNLFQQVLKQLTEA